MPTLVLVLVNLPVGERRILLRAPDAQTPQRIDRMLCGCTGRSVSMLRRHGADASDAGAAITNDPLRINDTTTGMAISSFQSPELSADPWLWFESSVSGRRSVLTVAVQFGCGRAQRPTPC